MMSFRQRRSKSWAYDAARRLRGQRLSAVRTCASNADDHFRAGAATWTGRNSLVGTLWRELLTDLGSEVASIERGPQARTVAELTDFAVEVNEPRRAAFSIRGGARKRKFPAMANMPAFVSKIPEWSTKFVAQWGAGQGRNLADSSGTFGHTAVKGLASRLGIKLKPWQAVKTADKVGRVAKHANKIGLALNILEGGKVAIDEIAQLQAERRRQSRRRTVVNGVMSEAERAATDLHADVRAQIDAEFRPYIAEIDGLRGQVVAAQENRSAASLELEQISRAARDLLDASS